MSIFWHSGGGALGSGEPALTGGLLFELGLLLGLLLGPVLWPASRPASRSVGSAALASRLLPVLTVVSPLEWAGASSLPQAVDVAIRVASSRSRFMVCLSVRATG
jgi:hypothetical protein